ncbi:nucleotide-binding protein [Streptomyces sp. NBC_01352]|uniref:nucleotide-binding protein n=1 Tax=Streptomyces sp. NBC_01352 TaxID=2903834 RepID=UPI002E34ED2A|nr:nucleotide-binding protein [Streptomyces sp. NBC_01352]
MDDDLWALIGAAAAIALAVDVAGRRTVDDQLCPQLHLPETPPKNTDQDRVTSSYELSSRARRGTANVDRNLLHLQEERLSMFENIFMQVTHEGNLSAEIRNLAQLRNETAGETISELRGSVLDSHGFLLPRVSQHIANYGPVLEQVDDAFSDFLRSHSPDYAKLEEAAAEQLKRNEHEERKLKAFRVEKEEAKARRHLGSIPPISERKWLGRFTFFKTVENPYDQADREYHSGLEHLQRERIHIAEIYTALKRIELARWEEWNESQQATEAREMARAELNISVTEAIRTHSTSWVEKELLSRGMNPRQGSSAMPEVNEAHRAGHESHRKVFLVHGRNEEIAGDMRAFLRALSLQPIEWSQAKASLKQGTPYVGDIVMAGMEMSNAAVILLTPDEFVDLHPELSGSVRTSADYQARPNVYYEAGIADALDRDRTIIVEVGTVRPFSDVSGRHVIRFDGSQQARLDLRDALRSADLSVDDSGRDWINVGSFEIEGALTPGWLRW